MKFNFNSTVQISDIAYPKTMELKELSVVAVFTSPKKAIICKTEMESLILGDGEVHDVEAGMIFDKGLDISTLVHEARWVNAENPNLLWNSKDRIVGYQDNDEVLIVDSYLPCPLIGETVDVSDYEWDGIRAFGNSILIHSVILVDSIMGDEVVMMADSMELEEYMFIAKGIPMGETHQEDRMNALPNGTKDAYPIIVTANKSISIGGDHIVSGVISARPVMQEMVTLEEWKVSRTTSEKL